MAFLILKHLRQRTNKKNFFFIPFIFTFLNALFGLFSVVKTVDEQFALAAYCILFAVCMDFCDGKLARAFNSCSAVGMELDSLCDAISFCFAPAMLLYGWKLHEYGIVGLLGVGIYLCCGLLRLAKFNANVMNSQLHFVGLPTTLAAFLIANLILAAPWIEQSSFSILLSASSILALTVALSVLMLSSIVFLSLKKVTVRALIRNKLLIVSLAFALLLLARGYPMVFLGTLIYILSSLILHIRPLIRMPRRR